MSKGHPEFPPRWSNRKALRVGFLTGRGHQSTDIASFLGDGTKANTVRRMWADAGLKDFGQHRNATYVPVRLNAYERKKISAHAASQGMTIEEWIRQVVVNAAVPENLFSAIVPGDE